MKLLINLLKIVTRKALLRDTITTTFYSSISKAVGFIIPLLIAAWFGANSDTDAFFLSYGIILFLSGIFGPVIESVIVPYILEIKIKKENIGHFVGAIIVYSGIGLSILIGIALFTIKPILSIFTKFDSSTLAVAYNLFKITSPMVILVIWTSTIAGSLNAFRKFAVPALAPVVRATTCIVIIVILKNRIGIASIAWGYIAGEFLRFSVLLLFLKISKLYCVYLSYKFDYDLRRFIKTASFQVVSMAMVGLNPIIDKIMATWLAAGSVSILHYSDRLNMIPITFLTTGLMVTILSYWSKTYTERGLLELRKSLQKVIKYVLPLTILIAILLFLVRRRLVYALLGRGNFSLSEVNSICKVWTYYLLGFVPYILAQIFVRFHLTLKNTKALLYCAILIVVTKPILNYFLMRKLNIAGIALSTSIISMLTLLYLMYSYRRECKRYV